VAALGHSVGQQEDFTSVYGAEYRFGGQHFWNSQLVIGLSVTPHRTILWLRRPAVWSSSSTSYGNHIDLCLGRLQPGGNGKNLGSAKEFYFEMSLAHRFANNTCIELAACYISHDDLFSNFDHGTDILAISFAFPMK